MTKYQNTYTQEEYYTSELIEKQKKWWKLLFNVQLPYKWNLNRLNPGFTLEIGSGIGRNLLHLNKNGVGIDHNPYSVEYAKKLNLISYTPDKFRNSLYYKDELFDSLLLSHVAEHMICNQLIDLIKAYSHLLKKDGKLIIITPQEAGFIKDKTHVVFMDFLKINKVVEKCSYKMLKYYSFPFPRLFGKIFIYNEFITVSTKKMTERLSPMTVL